MTKNNVRQLHTNDVRAQSTAKLGCIRSGIISQTPNIVQNTATPSSIAVSNRAFPLALIVLVRSSPEPQISCSSESHSLFC